MWAIRDLPVITTQLDFDSHRKAGKKSANTQVSVYEKRNRNNTVLGFDYANGFPSTLKTVYMLISNCAVNTLSLGYRSQSVNTVQ